MQLTVEKIIVGKIGRDPGGMAVALWCVALTLSLSSGPSAHAQLKTLSSGNADLQWRDAQLRLINEQLRNVELPGDLKKELTAQKGWLSVWDPKAKTNADETERGRVAKKPESLSEPTLDPNKLATPIRVRLFETKLGPTAADTKSLQKALGEHSGDIGLRQLQLHWVDQSRYRDDYWKEIIDAADRVNALLEKAPASDEIKLASTFAYYRKARSLAHCLRGRTSDGGRMVGTEKLSEAERISMQSTIGDCWRQIENRVGPGHVEFLPLEIYCLRRDGWSGRALELLELHAKEFDRTAYLVERESLLESLGWTKAVSRLAQKNLDRSRTLEIQYVPIVKK